MKSIPLSHSEQLDQAEELSAGARVTRLLLNPRDKT